MKRDTSADGFKNRVRAYALTHWPKFWQFVMCYERLARWVNTYLINSTVHDAPLRPNPFSLMHMSRYASWDSLTDKEFSSRHLPPGALPRPPLAATRALFAPSPQQGRQIDSKSTLLFACFAQWFTDGFLRTGRDRNGVRDWKMNYSNHEIDLCQVYGVDPKHTNILRARCGGELRSQIIHGEEYPPFLFLPGTNTKAPHFQHLPILIPNGGAHFQPLFPNPLPPAQLATLFATGSDRANLHVGYVLFNVLFLREHNRLAREMAKAHPDWSDERLFQTARNTLIVILIRIVLEDYINHITPYNFKIHLDPLPLANANWQRPNWMTLEFSLLYRWHMLMWDTVRLPDGRTVRMEDTFYNNDLLLQSGLGAMISAYSKECAGKIGLHNTPVLLAHADERSISLDRRARLRSYNDYRTWCGFGRVESFAQITGDPTLQKELENVYGTVDKVEFFVGLFAEDLRDNSVLGPTMGRMVGIDAFSQALSNPLLSRELYHPQTFSEVGWRAIQATGSLQDLVTRNVPQGSPIDVRFNRSATQSHRPPPRVSLMARLRKILQGTLIGEWRYVLPADYTWQSPYRYRGNWAFVDANLVPYMEIHNDGTITVRKGYAWDGCSPKIRIGPLSIGVPDGMIDPTTSLPACYHASLLHDACYQFFHSGLPLSRKEADQIFLLRLQQANFGLARFYWWAVRLAGWLVLHGMKRWRIQRGWRMAL